MEDLPAAAAAPPGQHVTSHEIDRVQQCGEPMVIRYQHQTSSVVQIFSLGIEK